MTTKQIYTIKQNCWTRCMESVRMMSKAAWPETGGHIGLVHNWYRCAQDQQSADLLIASRSGLCGRSDWTKAWNGGGPMSANITT